MKTDKTEHTGNDILDIFVTIEKLKLKQKSLLKQGVTIVIIAIVVIGVGVYGSFSEWTTFPILQAAIAAGAILLGIAFRPMQRCKNQLNLAEKKLRELQSLLKKR